jgi:hypothetical protein
MRREVKAWLDNCDCQIDKIKARKPWLALEYLEVAAEQAYDERHRFKPIRKVWVIWEKAEKLQGAGVRAMRAYKQPWYIRLFKIQGAYPREI